MTGLHESTVAATRLEEFSLVRFSRVTMREVFLSFPGCHVRNCQSSEMISNISNIGTALAFKLPTDAIKKLVYF